MMLSEELNLRYKLNQEKVLILVLVDDALWVGML